jgi:hypothetical protein
MIKLASILILLLFAAFLFGCTQQGQPPSQQPPGQPQVTAAPVEDVAAQALENNVPSSNENLTNLDDMLVNGTS